jgi:hypothetical protein
MTALTGHGDHSRGVGLEELGARSADSAAKASLQRLSQLEPGVAAQLQAVWSDFHASGRLLEQLLGGEKDERLQTSALVELIGIYEYFEEVRAPHGTNPSRPRA